MGLAILILLLGSGISRALRVMRGLPPAGRMLASGALAAVVGWSFAAVFELTLLRAWVLAVLYTLLGAIAALDRVTFPSSQVSHTRS
jgi:hypothetical protein